MISKKPKSSRVGLLVLGVWQFLDLSTEGLNHPTPNIKYKTHKEMLI